MQRSKIPGCLTAVVFLFLSTPAYSQSEPAQPAPSQAGEPEAGEPEPEPTATEKMLQAMDAGYAGYLAEVAGRFGVSFEERHDYQSLRDAVVTLAGEGLEQVLSEKGSGEAILACLQDVAENPVLTAELAGVARRDPNPRYVVEYVRTWCETMLTSPYAASGKVPARQVKTGRGKGDLIVARNSVWLSSDQGHTGNMNGHADPGELFELKLAVLNRSKTSPHLSASARLVLLDDKGRPCPFSETGAPVQNVPGECRVAAVVTQRLALPELSPGEQSTVGPFAVMLHPDVKGAVKMNLALEVEASGLAPSRTPLTLKTEQLPEIGLAAVKVDDDSTGGSRGNGNGRIEPGERIELRTKVELSHRKTLSKVGIRARQYSQFLDVAGKNLGLAGMRQGRAETVAGDFEFDVPTIEKMGEIPNEGPNRQFFTERKVALWFAVGGCAGRVRLDRNWASAVPDRYTCPYSAPGYRFVVNAHMPILFGQVFMISTDPPEADVAVNGISLGRTAANAPVLFTRVEPVRNSIVYYTIVTRKEGFKVAELKVPVIYKDETARNLTVDYTIRLESAVPLPEPVPEPFLTSRLDARREKDVPVDRVDPVELWGKKVLGENRHEEEARPSPPDKRSGRFRVFAGPALRWFSPEFQDEPGTDAASIYDQDQKDSPPFMAGFELGGDYFIIRGLHVFVTGQMFLTTKEPALSYYSNGADQNGILHQYKNQDGDWVSTQAKTDVSSFKTYSVTLGPGYEQALGPVYLSARVGFHMEGVTADGAVLDTKIADLKSGAPYSKMEPFLIGGRGEIGLGVDTTTDFIPYVRAFSVFPREYFDWGLCAGVEYQF